MLMADCVKSGGDTAAELLVHVVSEMSRTGHVAAELERALQAVRSGYSSDKGLKEVLHEECSKAACLAPQISRVSAPGAARDALC